MSYRTSRPTIVIFTVLTIFILIFTSACGQTQPEAAVGGKELKLTVTKTQELASLPNYFEQSYSLTDGSKLLAIEATIENLVFDESKAPPQSKEALINGVNIYATEGESFPGMFSFPEVTLVTESKQSIALTGFDVGAIRDGQKFFIASGAKVSQVVSPNKTETYTFVFIIPVDALNQSLSLQLADLPPIPVSS